MKAAPDLGWKSSAVFLAFADVNFVGMTPLA
jgi:hypothetical protein